jgi:hypothetical protein
LLGLGGCGGGETFGEAIGLEQKGPDELAVIKRPPLILPPDYNLRPPRPEERAAGGQAASERSRKTLIGPASSAENGGAAPNAAGNASAILTGAKPEKEAAAGASSEGQSVLLSRTDRAARDLDALVETRDENRVDQALLRRLLAWSPEDKADGGESAVQLVRRDQAPIAAGTEASVE